MRDDCIDDRGESLDRRDVTVDQPERLAVVGADTDLDAPDAVGGGEQGRVDVAQLGDVTDGGLVDDTTHLQAGHLAEDHSVFHIGRGTRRADHVGQREVFSRG